MKPDFNERVTRLASVWGVRPYEEFGIEGVERRLRVTERGLEMYSEFAGKWFQENIPAWALKNDNYN